MKIDELYKKKDRYFNKYTDNLFSGMIDEGKDIGEIKEGLKIGLWKETFDENTTLEGEYIEGKNHGKWVVKHNNLVRSIKKYNKGILVSDEYFDEFNNKI